MRLIRRTVRKIGFLGLTSFAWNHRGTVVRLVDLAGDVPRFVREDGLGGITRRGRLLVELDRVVPTDTKVRISGLENGSVTLAGDPGPEALSLATEALCGVEGVTDVRTDGSDHPVVTAV